MKINHLFLAFALVFCFSASSSFAQKDNKKVIYQDLEGEKICKRKFKKRLDAASFVQTRETENVIIKQLQPRIVEGQLTSISQGSISKMVTAIETILQQKIDPDKNLLLHYYKQHDDIFKKDVADSLYWGFMDKHSSEFASFLIGSKESSITQDKDNYVFIDDTNYLESTIFTEPNIQLYHLLIRPNGTYKLYFGDFDIVYTINGILEYY
ncbi:MULTISPECIES: hypothetical protein [Bizionia]|uniref:DUF4919 domain-containing protein n=1 Tax=Bizionia algoritergicola TaxID=291187 RepID=A0A5D0QZ57_9FLAO|nr:MULTISPECIES: hypothetical protein [Bizionia]OBX21207.1 hypothetical protein BAA08_13595 [Bizionia sp. APA-3]TYB73758.1 hypothetical protein ES675_08935 [Bizionia algoritergicola]